MNYKWTITPPRRHDYRIFTGVNFRAISRCPRWLPAIIGKPSENYVQNILRQNFQVLQDINFRDGTKATVLILSEVGHKAVNKNQVFERTDGALEAYNPSIQDAVRLRRLPTPSAYAVRLCQENNWSRKLNHQAAIQIAERVRKTFTFSCVEETWMVRLKNETALFKHVTLRDILVHLRAAIMGGEAINVIRLQQECYPCGSKNQESPSLLPPARTRSGIPGKPVSPYRTHG